MKITREYLKELIKSEMENSLEKKSFDIREVKEEETLNTDAELSESLEKVKDHTLLSETERNIEELKSITSEIKRMKQLVDFRRPLLSDESFSEL